MLSGIESTPTPKDSKLVPEDFDLALRRMKNDLALLDLRRSLLQADLDAPTVLALADRILELQRAA
jgi:hypothetical protein